jgi:hypothetical protein
MPRVAPWLYSAFLFAGAAAFLIAAQVQSSAADRYRHASECQDATRPDCFQLSAGTIRSVGVSQSRSGERDTTVIDTRDAPVTVILEPAASDASHVRSGATVTVKWYLGKVTLVEVDGIAVPSADNPADQQSQLGFYGILLLALGALSILWSVWLRRRRAARAPRETGLEETILPTGGTGWIVKPSLRTSTVLRLGVLCAAVILLTLRALLDPARTAFAATLDVLIIGLVGLVLVVHFRNSKVIAERNTITKVNWLGRSVSYQVSEVNHADRFRSSASRYLVFAGRDGRQLFRVSGIYWDFDQLDQVCHKVGIHETGGYDEVVGALAIEKRAGANTNWVALAGQLAALIVFIIVVVVLLNGPTSR